MTFQQREQLAYFAGYRTSDDSFGFKKVWLDPRGERTTFLPNFALNRNAVHEVAVNLDHTQRIRFVQELVGIMEEGCGEVFPSDVYSDIEMIAYLLIDSTPAQQTAALIRTLGY
jgi:hypothetical protein